MPNEFDNIKNLAGWRNKLDELLIEARKAAQTDDLESRLQMADRLTEFIINNPPAIQGDPASAEYEEMDRIARECHDALILDSVQQRVSSIMSRTAELAVLRKKFDSTTASNQKAALVISLEKTRRVVESTTAAIAAMADLKKDIEQSVATGSTDPDISALANQIGLLIEKLQSVCNHVESIQ